jgi:hypothetical protein
MIFQEDAERVVFDLMLEEQMKLVLDYNERSSSATVGWAEQKCNLRVYESMCAWNFDQALS